MSDQSDFFPDRVESLLVRKLYLNVVHLEFFTLSKNTMKFAEITLKQRPRTPAESSVAFCPYALRRGLQGSVWILLLFGPSSA